MAATLTVAVLALAAVVVAGALQPRRPAVVATAPAGPSTLPLASATLRRGDKAPLSGRAPLLSGAGEVALGRLAGGRPLVVNFFASWCSACQAELDAFAAVSAAESARVRFVGIDTNDSDPGAARAALRAAGARYLVVSDPAPALRLAEAFGVRDLPATFFVDRAGRVEAEVLGTEQRPALARRVAALLASR